MTTPPRPAPATDLRVLVCGGREFFDAAAVDRVLDRVHRLRGIALVIHGEATGADTLAHQWAVGAGVPIEGYPADWHAHGLSAGMRRNHMMLREGQPDVVIAFPGGIGTAMMIEIAGRAGVPVWAPYGQETPHEALARLRSRA